MTSPRFARRRGPASRRRELKAGKLKVKSNKMKKCQMSNLHLKSQNLPWTRFRPWRRRRYGVAQHWHAGQNSNSGNEKKG